MKHLRGLGVGSKVEEAHAFSEDEENKLRDLGLLGDSSPEMRDLLCINPQSIATSSVHQPRSSLLRYQSLPRLSVSLMFNGSVRKIKVVE